MLTRTYIGDDDGGPDLWTLVRRPGWIDQRQVIPALRRTLIREDADDYRTRLLAFDASQVLRQRGVEVPPELTVADPRSVQEPDECGFPSLPWKIVMPTDPKTIETVFRKVGREVRQPAELNVGGSCALILRSLIVRPTQDVDVVDELPEVIRQNHDLLNRLVRDYDLQLAHFQSHYLPDGWRDRVSTYGVFGSLTVRLVDAYDVLSGKVFSKRPKDQRDIRTALEQLDLDPLRRRVAGSTTSLRKVPGLAKIAEDNWYVLTGEETLPDAP